jgi:hypothetical protein
MSENDRRTSFICERCGKEGLAKTSWQRFCGPACQNKAWREQRSAETLRRRRDKATEPQVRPFGKSTTMWNLSCGAELADAICVIGEREDGSLTCSHFTCWQKPDCAHRRLFRSLRLEEEVE